MRRSTTGPPPKIHGARDILVERLDDSIEIAS